MIITTATTTILLYSLFATIDNVLWQTKKDYLDKLKMKEFDFSNIDTTKHRLRFQLVQLHKKMNHTIEVLFGVDSMENVIDWGKMEENVTYFSSLIRLVSTSLSIMGHSQWWHREKGGKCYSSHWCFFVYHRT